jgi:hypothetical protein
MSAFLTAFHFLLDLAIRISPTSSKGMETQNVPALATLLRFNIARTRAATMHNSPSTRMVVDDIACCLSFDERFLNGASFI